MDYVSQLMMVSAEQAFLSEIPPDFEYGETGRTVGEQLELLESQRAAIPSLDSVNGFWLTASERDKEVFADFLLVHGETAAYANWLKTQR